MHWPKTTITAGSGEIKPAIAPVIISASRSTDIPAFYGEWLMRRIAAGYVRWMNPWSGKPVYVSLEQARLFVFWSKNPAPFFPFLGEIERRGYNYYFLVTLNDYEKEGLEKGVPRIGERLNTFKKLAERIGRERVLWRFDPLLVTDTLSSGELLARIERIGDAISGSAGRLIFSFIACYPKVKRNLAAAGIRLREWDPEARERIVAGIAGLCRAWNIPAVTCADETDYSGLGVARGKCVDDGLIGRLFAYDEKLTEFLRRGGDGKDKGQRRACGCCISKDIGRYDTCGHRCVYCYANTSPETALMNLNRSDSTLDSIVQ